MQPLLVLVSSFFLVSCATIFSGTTQTLKVTSDPSGASVSIEPVATTGTTPGEFVLRRKDAPYRVTVSLDGYDDISFLIAAATNGWAYGNLILGGIIGIVVDMLTGAAVSLEPSEVHANLVPLETSDRSSLLLLAPHGRMLGRADFEASSE